MSAHSTATEPALVAPTWTMRGGPPRLPVGPEGIRTLFAGFGQIEQAWTIEHIVAEGNLMVVRAINDCVMDSFLGIDGRGKRQLFSATFIHRIDGGLVQETWRNADDLGRVVQLGARIVPGTGA